MPIHSTSSPAHKLYPLHFMLSEGNWSEVLYKKLGFFFIKQAVDTPNLVIMFCVCCKMLQIHPTPWYWHCILTKEICILSYVTTIGLGRKKVTPYCSGSFPKRLCEVDKHRLGMMSATSIHDAINCFLSSSVYIVGHVSKKANWYKKWIDGVFLFIIFPVLLCPSYFCACTEILIWQ